MRRVLRRGLLLGIVLLGSASAQAQLELLWARGGIARGVATSYQAEVTRDGTRAILIGGDRYLRVVRLADGVLERLIALPSGTPYCIDLSSDDSILAVGTRQSAVWLLRFEDGAPLSVVYPHNGLVDHVEFTTDDAYLVTAGAHSATFTGVIQRIRLSDFLFLPNPSILAPFAVSRNREFLAGYEGSRLQIRRWSDGTLVRQIPGEITTAFTPAFSPDNQYLLGVWNNQIHAWHLFDSTRDRTNLGTATFVNWLRFNPDGTRLVVGRLSNLLIFNSASFQQLGSIPVPFTRIAFCPDSDGFVGFESSSYFALWSLEQRQRVRELTAFVALLPLLCVASHDGAHLITLNDRVVRWWRVSTGALERTQQVSLEIRGATASSLTPHMLIETLFQIQLIRTDTGELVYTFSPSAGSFRLGSFSTDGRYFCYTVASPSRLEVRATQTGTIVATLPLPSNFSLAYAFLLDRDRVLLVGQNGYIGVWSIPQARPLAETLRTGTLFAGALSRDGTLLALAFDQQIFVLDTTTLATVSQMSVASGRAQALAISPCRRYLAASNNEGRLSLYRIADGTLASQKLVAPGAPTAATFSVLYDPQGRTIASVHGSPDLFVHRNPYAPPDGDVNGDGCVDDADLLIVLFAFGGNEAQSDVNRDGVVDDADLLIVLFNFSSGC